MKFVCILFLWAFLPAEAQEIKRVNNPEGSSEEFYTTRLVKIVQSKKANLSIAFTQTATETRLQLSGSHWGTGTIDKGDLLIITLANGKLLTAKSINLQSFIPSDGKDTYTHQYAIAAEDVDLLSKYNIVSFRKFFFTDFTDLDIPIKGARELKVLGDEFLKKQRRSKIDNPNVATMVIPPFPKISVNKAKEFIGKRVTYCAPVFITRFFESGHNQATILDFQSSKSGPPAKAIIWQQDKMKWGNLPRAFFTGKEVCISGTLYLYDGDPYIQISDKSQLKIVSPLTTDEASFFINDSLALTGVVEKISYNKKSDEAITLLLRSPYAKQAVTVRLRNNTFSDADHNGIPVLNKTIVVNGKVEQHKNELYITVNNWDALQVKVN